MCNYFLVLLLPLLSSCTLHWQHMRFQGWIWCLSFGSEFNSCVLTISIEPLFDWRKKKMLYTNLALFINEARLKLCKITSPVRRRWNSPLNWKAKAKKAWKVESHNNYGAVKGIGIVSWSNSSFSSIKAQPALSAAEILLIMVDMQSCAAVPAWGHTLLPECGGSW